jgi:transcription elongation GreA/GreB family factor
MSSANPTFETRTSVSIPLTVDVLRRLHADAEQLAAKVSRLQAMAQENGFSGDPDSRTVLAAGDLHLAARRLEALRRVMADSHVVEPDGRAVVGSRVAVHHADGEHENFELVASGEAEAPPRPHLARLSAGRRVAGKACGLKWLSWMHARDACS